MPQPTMPQQAISLTEQLQEAYFCGREQFGRQVLLPLEEEVQHQKEQTKAHPPQMAVLLEALKPFSGTARGQIDCLLEGVLLADTAKRLLGKEPSVVMQSRAEGQKQQSLRQALTLYLLFQSRNQPW